ncbi:MAG: HupE/UreJ family protein, partial [Burkholderiales bacterium]
MAASRRLGVLAIMMVIAQPAWAHHPMDGKLPQTFLQGLLSGFGHPVIGVDHLAAIVGVGILAALVGRSAAVVLAFSVSVIAGVGLHLSGIDLPASELFDGLTTLLI